MKFGKQLRLAATPAWDDFYVNYKEAKQLLKRKLAKAEAAAEQNDPRALEEVVNKIRDVVAKCLKTEIVKYDNFCKKQILSVEKASRAITDEARDATVSLVRSLSSSRLPASNHEAAAAPELGAVVAAGGNSALAVKVEDGEVIKLKLLGENKAHHNVGGTVSAGTVLSAVNTPRASGDEAEDEPEVDEEEMAASAARHNQLVRLERRLSSLEKFFAINCTAITKLVKKYAKKFAKFNSSVAGVVEPILIKKQQAREADLAKVRSHVTLTLSDIPQAPMVQEGTLDVDDSSDFGVNTDVLNVDEIELKKLPVAAITNLSVAVSTNGLGENIRVPVIVAKGKYAGPVVGITCAIHGNELNGIPVVFRVVRELDVEEMCGILIAVPVLNPPGFLRHQREFSDGQDLNRLFPGSATGNSGSQYVHLIQSKILSHMEYVVDLHTASFGRINSLYVRADMGNPVVKKIALLQNPQIVVHNSSPDGSLRGHCMRRGVPCVTVEIGNPSTFHPNFLKAAFVGVENILSHLKVIPDPVEAADTDAVICNSSSWTFATHGGILQVTPKLCEWVKVGQVIAQIRNIYGDVTHVYRAQSEGIVIGKNTNPVCQRGDRLLHLGYVTGDEFAAYVSDGH